MEHLRSVREHGVAESSEFILRPAGGDPCPAQLTSAAAAPGRGASSNVRCTLVDVSERRREEEERERRIVELVVVNQRLEQTQRQLLQADKMAAIGQLAAGVAHEINNPLCYALSNLFLLDGYVQALFERRPAATDPPAGADVAGVEPVKRGGDLEAIRLKMVQSLAESRDGLERVSRVVRDLGTFAHPDTGSLQVTDLHELIEGALRIVAGALGPSARVIRAYGAEGLKLRCRPYQLGQVFMNLLVNAAQASPPSATITVRTGKFGEEAWIEIEDVGSGIAPEHLDRIFEPFFTTKPIGVGTGLGLSIARAIVRGHGGRIEVRSEVGAGSLFRVHLPVDGVVRPLEGGPDRFVS
jgi:signal transduction histidine kinase